MVMPRCTAVSTIVIGIVELSFAVVLVICGAITTSKFSGEAAASAGLWSLFFAIPGILSIVAGISKNTVVMAFALFFNILAFLVSGAAAFVCAIFAATISDFESTCLNTLDNKCICSSTQVDNRSTFTFNTDCSNLDMIRVILIVLAVTFAIEAIVSFIGSILGCMGTCCVPAEPVIIMAGGMPVQGGSTVVVQSSQSSMHGGYPAYLPGYEPPYADHNPLVKNAAI